MSEPLIEFHHDGLRFDVIDAGPQDGEVIIALHGFPQRATSWSTVTPDLVAAGYRVLAFDQRGYSADARPTGVDAYRLDRLADDVLALADEAGAATFHVLGHDWGGAVAWYLASRNADRVRTVSVASTPHPRAMITALRGRQALKSWYMGVFQLPRLPEWLLGARNGAGARRLLAGAPDAATGVALLSDPAAASALLNWYRAMRLPVSPPPGVVTVPTLYVWGDRDIALGRPAAELTERWVSGPYQFVVLPGASHWLLEKRPAELARLVLAHLGAHRS